MFLAQHRISEIHFDTHLIQKVVLTWVFIETHTAVKYLAFLLRICATFGLN